MLDSVKIVDPKGGDADLSELTNWIFLRGIIFDFVSLVTDLHEFTSLYGLVSLIGLEVL